ncbi:VirB4 family type IV secretion/conjugal transfer ATPase [Fusobacterium necrophorum]|uniref:Conjugal transfer protein TrbE n=1 Tax=Fusobacterium necrophorum TaxID=859 RepID=A0A4Q2L1G9_9FUSO|nr:conjugal transfer protein TrbE [Fusobacterium necrophorum]RXZ70700.1 conjugal transfer protein TrbE [Fusobacterium necrophorum]
MGIVVVGVILFFLLFYLKGEREYNYKEKDSVPNYLPWGYLIHGEEGVICNKNGSFQKTFVVRGIDVNSHTAIELVAMRAQINDVLKRLDGRWSLFMEARRSKVKPYESSKFSEKVLQKIDECRRKTFNSGDFYTTDVYLTFCYLPSIDAVSKLKKTFIEDSSFSSIDRGQNFEDFQNELEEHYNLLKTNFHQIRSLNNKETLTYLHSCFSQFDEQVIMPQHSGIFLDAYLSDTSITNGLNIKVGEYYVSILSILSMPISTCPGFFDQLNKLGLEYRWMSRYIFLGKEEGKKLARVYKGRWSMVRSSVIDWVEARANKKIETEASNLEADDRSEEAIELSYDLQNNAVGFGYYTFSLLLKNKDPKQLKKDVELATACIQNLGIVTVEESIGALEAFFGSMPGNIQHNVRKPGLTTMNLIDMLPVTSIWAGERKNAHLQDKALLVTVAEDETTPFFFNLHQGDVGHTAVFGQTGGGKSVLLNTIAAQFKKYKDSQVFFFDKGGSSRVLTENIGGLFHDLGEYTVAFQPLREIGIVQEYIEKKKRDLQEQGKEITEELLIKITEEEKARAILERSWVAQWLKDIYTQENVLFDEKKENALAEALISLAELPVKERTMTGLQLLIQEEQLRMALKPYCKGGDVGHYFDGEEDSFDGSHSWQVFEMETLLQMKKASNPVLQYIFHKLEREAFSKGFPTLLILDECWFVLDSPFFSSKMREWLKTLRKKNVSVLFATQELTDVLKSSIRDSILASCPTTIFLPYAKAYTENYIPLYRTFGLNDKEIWDISRGTPKRDYYYKSISGTRMFKLNLTEYELAYVAASDTDSQKAIQEIKKELESKNLSKDELLEVLNQEWEKYKKVNQTKDVEMA